MGTEVRRDPSVTASLWSALYSCYLGPKATEIISEGQEVLVISQKTGRCVIPSLDRWGVICQQTPPAQSSAAFCGHLSCGLAPNVPLSGPTPAIATSGSKGLTQSWPQRSKRRGRAGAAQACCVSGPVTPLQGLGRGLQSSFLNLEHPEGRIGG